MKATAGASAALVLLGTGIVATMTRGHRTARAAAGSPSGLRTTLVIESLLTPESATIAGTQRSFAESLAVHLERLPGLEVRVATGQSGTGTGFILHLNNELQGQRFVIASRLYEAGKQPPIWTATFWRDRGGDSSFVNDLAAEVAEALYGHLARRSVISAREEQ